MSDPIPRTNGRYGIDNMRLAVGIATLGRPQVLSRTLDRLAQQTRRPDAIFVCSPSEEDVQGLSVAHPQVTFCLGPRGSSHQRNAILKQLDDVDVAVFFDDDFIACPNYISSLVRLLAANSDIVVATGLVLADGILGPGLSIEEADTILLADGNSVMRDDAMEDVFSAYGCNIAVRLAPARRNHVLFDEHLPLYAWLEDVDFSRQLAPYGRIVKLHASRGVHLGVKTGRQSGVKLGYSQIANPIFLVRKGTCTWQRALFLMSRNVAANVVRSVRPEPWVDRVGRLRGNARAVLDLVTGRLRPDRVLSL